LKDWRLHGSDVNVAVIVELETPFVFVVTLVEGEWSGNNYRDKEREGEEKKEGREE